MPFQHYRVFLFNSCNFKSYQHRMTARAARKLCRLAWGKQLGSRGHRLHVNAFIYSW